MPLYLVRWPDLSASLVKATDEAELLDTLDEVANSEGCTWSVYRGPIFLDFSLPADVKVNWPTEGKAPITVDQIKLKNVAGLRERGLSVEFASADAGDEMKMEIVRRCFPALHKVWCSDGKPSDAELREAAMADLEPLIRADWRKQTVKRGTDPASQLATAMGMPLALARKYIDRSKSPRKPPK